MAARHSIENLRHGADVFTQDGHEVGELHAVVIDPQDRQVTHIVVNAGPRFPEPGFGSPTLVSVDIDQLLEASENRVDLAVTEAQFKELPLYGHQHFIDVPDQETPTPAEREQREKGGPAQFLWNAGLAIAASLSSLATGIAVPAEHFRKASFERHILNDTPVWRRQPSAHIGDVERVLVDEATDEIRAIVIRRGAFFERDVVLPIEYVTEITDGVIRADISNEDLERLEPFDPGV